ncbi:response regulator transcription factor [Roseibacillus ishigakijimensis]|uniref:response regulator transcription factor n=1 Tax=Roseibacillus ishigakijimensis TaxID=454146 RepID=UPI0027DC124D|nr:response regulator transcription factor [Roseibacillus ishigakijimensis]
MSDNSGKILVVEDERDVAELVGFNLERAGYEVILAHDGLRGQELALKERPDLIVLDLMLPGKDGYSVFKDLRRDNRTSHTPVLMLTARAQTEDRIKGLEVGADDYLTKPFSPKELVLRVNAIMRRTESTPGSVEVSAGPFRLDKNNMSFYLNEERVDLTSTEFKLLLFLVERPDSAQDRNQLLRTVWGYSDEVHSRTLDTHMKRLRSKLGPYANLVETVRGIGYRLNVS